MSCEPEKTVKLTNKEAAIALLNRALGNSNDSRSRRGLISDAIQLLQYKEK